MIPAAKLVTLLGAKAVLTFCLAGTAAVFALLPPVALSYEGRAAVPHCQYWCLHGFSIHRR